MSKIHHDEGVIEIEFPKDKFAKYMTEVKGNDVKELTNEQRHQIFMKAIEDWKKGTLFLEELSEIAGYMWSYSGVDRSGELAEALYDCSEMNFYMRKSDKVGALFSKLLKGVMKYYDKHRTIN